MRRRFGSGSAKERHRASQRNQIVDLILHGSLTTTEARAKVLKSKTERLISRAKKTDLATRRRVLAFLQKNQAAEKLFTQLVPQFQDRVGGYVRVVKLPPRHGDNAPRARVEFVEEIKEKVTEQKVAKVTKVKKHSPLHKASEGKNGKKDGKKNKDNKGKRG